MLKMRISALLCLSLVSVINFSCKSEVEGQTGEKNMIKVTSTAFKEGEMIPAKYTCDGEDVSPPLAFGEVPEKTLSLALICDDPDAPRETFVHWVVYNLPGERREIEEKYPAEKRLPDGSRQGETSFGKTGYGGPCPPSGTHRYYFKVYALDKVLTIEEPINKESLVEAMKTHVIAEGQLMGRYARR